MAKKQVIRLTENDLHKIIKESVNKILNEGKYVNHKPFFKHRTGDESFKLPGDGGAIFYNNDNYWQLKGFKNQQDAEENLTRDEFEQGENEYLDMLKKHDNRAMDKYFGIQTDLDNGNYKRIPIFSRDIDNYRYIVNNANKKYERGKNDGYLRMVNSHLIELPEPRETYYDRYSYDEDGDICGVRPATRKIKRS